MDEIIKSKAKRLNEVFDYLKFERKLGTLKNFAKELKWNYSNVSQAMKGNEVYLTDNFLENVCNVFSEIDFNWLLTGEGEMIKPKEIQIHEVTAVPEEAYMMAEFAVLNGNGGRLGGGDVANLPETQTRLIPREYEKGNYLVVKITGNSMNDGTDRSISDGDDVLIRELEPDEWDDLPIRTRLFVITSREGNVIKQITEVNKDEGYIMCHSFNQSYVDFKIQFSDIYQIFVVYKIVKKQITL